MRRLFILFMLCLLPVQITWAAVVDYCGHEATGDVQHLAHHADEHEHVLPFNGDLPVNSADPLESNFGHDHCHLSGFIALLSPTILNAAILPTLPALHGENFVFSSQMLDRPERPKWHPLA